MELIDRIKKDIDDRLEELRPQIEEIPRLEAALAAFDATGGEGATATRRRAARRGPPAGRRGGGGRRARRGQRREELLQLIKGNPEITIAEAARQMGVSPPQVSTLVRRLREEGTVRREDGRFIVVEPAAGAGAGEDAVADEVQGPGVEGLDAPPVDEETAEAPEAARDEAGRPQAT